MQLPDLFSCLPCQRFPIVIFFHRDYSPHPPPVCILNKFCVWRACLPLAILIHPPIHVNDKLKCESVDCHLFCDTQTRNNKKSATAASFSIPFELDTVPQSWRNIHRCMGRRTCINFIISSQRRFFVVFIFISGRRWSDTSQAEWDAEIEIKNDKLNAFFIRNLCTAVIFGAIFHSWRFDVGEKSPLLERLVAGRTIKPSTINQQQKV